jgi:hypothetical protein
MTGFKYNKILIICSLIVALSAINSCSPVLKLSSGRKIESTCNPDQQYHIFSEFYNLNSGYNIIDRIHTQGNFFKGYNITKSIDLLESGMCTLKGNALKIIKITNPTPFGSQSYDITADVLLLNTIPDFKFSVIDNTFKIDSQFYYIQIVRPKRVIGSKTSFPIYIDNEYACSIENNSLTTIKLSDSISSVNVESLGKLIPMPIIQEKGFINYIECKVSLFSNTKFHDISKKKNVP